MKTTNFFIDFIIIGFIAITCVITPVYMHDHTILMNILTYKTKDQIHLAPLITIAIYILGIIFNQLADFLISMLKKVLKLQKIEEASNNIKVKLDKSYHECLQNIVYKSQSAYDYLSYRRSIIRIIRALIIASIIIILSHIIISIIYCFITQIQIHLVNSIIMTILIFSIFFLRTRLIKIHSGYYLAIQNFQMEIQSEIEREPTTD